MFLRDRLPAAVFLALATIWICGSGRVNAAPQPSFTAAQRDAGAVVYGGRCANCHGADLEGKSGPMIIGTWFIDQWSTNGKTLAVFHDFLKSNMPMDAPGSLSETQYYDVIAYLLARNGYATGSVALNLATSGQALNLPNGDVPPAVSTASRFDKPQPPASVAKASTSRPDDREIDKPSDSDWLMYNHTLDGSRYSGLAQIDANNAGKLAPTCMFQLGEIGAFEAAPVVYDGLMYVTSPYSTYAINPATCVKAWKNTYPVGAPTPSTVSRGVAIYKGKLFRTTPDCHLLAIDAKTGTLLWDVLLCDQAHGYWLSAAPVAYDGKVFVGEAGADWGANGHVYALDAETGKALWTFNVIPTGNEIGADTWKAGSERGGGSMWSTYTLQPQKGLLYVSVGNPAPDFIGAGRPGDNLFTNSVVVLDYRTGKLAWWVQQVAHDVHDWDTAAAPVIYQHDGEDLMAVTNKAGWLYIYNRATHKLIARPEISDHANADAPITEEGIHHCPGNVGGGEWNGPAYSPRDQLLFVNSIHFCGVTRLSENRYIEGLAYFGGSYTFDPPSTAYGWTRAFNAGTGKPAWVRRSDTPMLAALTPTAGGVVFTGDLGGNFLALDSKSGDVLYRFNTGGPIAGAPSTYEVAGKQYVAITSGNESRFIWKSEGAMTVVVFSLPAH